MHIKLYHTQSQSRPNHQTQSSTIDETGLLSNYGLWIMNKYLKGYLVMKSTLLWKFQGKHFSKLKNCIQRVTETSNNNNYFCPYVYIYLCTYRVCKHDPHKKYYKLAIIVKICNNNCYQCTFDVCAICCSNRNWNFQSTPIEILQTVGKRQRFTSQINLVQKKL